jgi:hypothetical protein
LLDSRELLMSRPDAGFFAEYAALTSGAGLLDCSDRTQIEIAGDDRAPFLHNLTTAAIRSLLPGQGCEAFALDVRGHTLGHFLVFCTPHSLIIDSVGGQNERLAMHFERYHIRERIEIHDRTEQWGQLLLSGLKARMLLENLVGATSDGAFPAEPLSHCQARISGHTVWLRNVEIAGSGGMLISAARESIAPVAEAILAAGGMQCGAAALETVRIEAGWPVFGVDISDKNLPQEVGRNARAISFTKGCYLGQETVARIDALGHVNKTLCRVRFKGHEVPLPGVELRSGDAAVGNVTSAAFSPRLSAPLALAYIRRGLNIPGTKFTSVAGDAEIIALPLT